MPIDMVYHPPLPCGFEVDDEVIYTNDYGARFRTLVRGFAKDPLQHQRGARAEFFIYLDLTAWWFPVHAAALAKFNPAKDSALPLRRTAS